MKRITLVLGWATLLGSLMGCAHYPDVRPGAEGLHKVAVTAEDKEQGARNALNQANDYCGESDKKAAIVDENSKYTGDMSEKDYNKAKKISKVVGAAGSTVGVFSRDQKTKDAGWAVGMGGGIADGAFGKAYTVEMKFKCQ
jgi:hypothetical protein